LLCFAVWNYTPETGFQQETDAESQQCKYEADIYKIVP
jgi:hypothetical protein